MHNISFWLNHCQSDHAYSLLAQYGYKHDWIKHGDIGGITARISGRFFEWDKDGDFYIAQPIWRDIPSGKNLVTEPILYDVIAWTPSNPAQWYFLRGEHNLILGEKAMHRASICNEPIQLHATPFAWLKAGCRGSVLLDCHGLDRLYGLSEVVCESVDQGKRIKKGLSMYYLKNMPRLSVSIEAKT